MRYINERKFSISSYAHTDLVSQAERRCVESEEALRVHINAIADRDAQLADLYGTARNLQRELEEARQKQADSHGTGEDLTSLINVRDRMKALAQQLEANNEDWRKESDEMRGLLEELFALVEQVGRGLSIQLDCITLYISVLLEYG